MEFFGSKANNASLILALSIGIFSMAQSAVAAGDKPICDKGSIGTACEPEDEDIVINKVPSTKRVMQPGTGPTNPLPDHVGLPTNKLTNKVQIICEKGSIGMVCEPEDKDIVINKVPAAKRAIKATN